MSEISSHSIYTTIENITFLLVCSFFQWEFEKIQMIFICNKNYLDMKEQEVDFLKDKLVDNIKVNLIES